MSAVRARHRFVTACLNAGLVVGKQPPVPAVREAITQLHPVLTERSLIRVGSEQDGGYLIPDDLEGVAACFSPGVDAWAPFEADLIGRGVPCFMADGSVESPPIQGPEFLRKFLGVVNDEKTVRLDDWVANAPEGDLLLQMDIEGAEWPVLLNVSDETLRRFRIVVIELHDLERMMDRWALPIIDAVIGRLRREFLVVHLHPNNYGGFVRKGGLVIPRALEITLLRHDRAQPIGLASEFPHPLDRPNGPELPDMILPSGWYRAF